MIFKRIHLNHMKKYSRLISKRLWLTSWCKIRKRHRSFTTSSYTTCLFFLTFSTTYRPRPPSTHLLINSKLKQASWSVFRTTIKQISAKNNSIASSLKLAFRINRLVLNSTVTAMYWIAPCFLKFSSDGPSTFTPTNAWWKMLKKAIILESSRKCPKKVAKTMLMWLVHKPSFFSSTIS